MTVFGAVSDVRSISAQVTKELERLQGVGNEIDHILIVARWLIEEADAYTEGSMYQDAIDLRARCTELKGLIFDLEKSLGSA